MNRNSFVFHIQDSVLWLRQLVYIGSFIYSTIVHFLTEEMVLMVMCPCNTNAFQLPIITNLSIVK